ncbi:hypothetical protein YC2023_092436 [Brassica napus]
MCLGSSFKRRVESYGTIEETRRLLGKKRSTEENEITGFSWLKAHTSAKLCGFTDTLGAYVATRVKLWWAKSVVKASIYDLLPSIVLGRNKIHQQNTAIHVTAAWHPTQKNPTAQREGRFKFRRLLLLLLLHQCRKLVTHKLAEQVLIKRAVAS